MNVRKTRPPTMAEIVAERELGGCLQFEVLARSRSRSLHSVVNRVEQRFTAR